MITWLLAAVALATPSFDPNTPAERFEGDETFNQAGDVKLWSAIERWEDPDPTLFVQEAFNDGTTWKDTDYSPWIRSCFRAGKPHSKAFLLHAGPNAEIATGTPIVFVPGAGDNGSRGFITMATRFDRKMRPVYVITFAHPHGDVFRQAEIVADAIAAVKAKTGAAQVDLVAHSKGGPAALMYTSHEVGAEWGTTAAANAYEAVGTAYRDDVRRLVLVASPLGGIDTAFRWPANNFFGLDADAALGPTSWDRYYSTTTSFPLVYNDLSEQDFLPADGDLFPGQRQLLARQDFPLPGSLTWIGGYSLQTDWYSTYEGGLGFYSRSQGIDDAVEAGGNLVARFRNHGVDPDVEVFLLAGKNPLMPNGDATLAEMWQSIGADESDWADLIAKINAHVPMSADEDELDGLENGDLVLGEVTGPSDGLVFVDSALDERAVTKRGAVVVDTKIADLSHLDLLYASPITGQLLQDAADDEAGNDWMRGVGKRYSSEDTLGWVEAKLADPGDPLDTGALDTDEPGGSLLPDGTGPFIRPCGGCQTGSTPGGSLLTAILGLSALFASRRRTP